MVTKKKNPSPPLSQLIENARIKDVDTAKDIDTAKDGTTAPERAAKTTQHQVETRLRRYTEIRMATQSTSLMPQHGAHNHLHPDTQKESMQQERSLTHMQRNR